MMIIISSIVAVCMAVAVMFIRIKSSAKPATAKKLFYLLSL